MFHSSEDFWERLSEGRAVIALVGTSGNGKTHWARQFSRLNVGLPATVIGCDDEIELRLRPNLQHGGYHGLDGVSAWMGQPWEARYEANQTLYLQHERAVMQEALDAIERWPYGNLVIDTTGSLPHVGADVSERLKRLAFVIYLACTPAERIAKVATYLDGPRPVAFAEHWRPLPELSHRDNLARCLPELIAARHAHTDGIADVKLWRCELQPPVTIDDMLKLAVNRADLHR